MKTKKSIAGALGGAAGYAGAQNYRALNPGKDGMILSPFLGRAVAGQLAPKALAGAAEQQAAPGADVQGYGSAYETSNLHVTAPGNVNVEETWDEFDTSGSKVGVDDFIELTGEARGVDDVTNDEMADNTDADDIAEALSMGSDDLFAARFDSL